MSEACKLGGENRDEINKLKFELSELKNEIELLKKLKADADAIHKIELEISNITGAIREMQNNRKEDRQVISSMNETIGEVSTILEEYVKGSIKQSVQQEIFNEKQEEQSLMMIKMSDAISKNSISNQIKEFSNTSKYHKWFLRFVLFMLLFTLVGMFNFYNLDINMIQDIFNFIRGG